MGLPAISVVRQETEDFDSSVSGTPVGENEPDWDQDDSAMQSLTKLRVDFSQRQ